MDGFGMIATADGAVRSQGSLRMKRLTIASASLLSTLTALLCAGSAHAATLQVGPGKTYTKPCAAIAAAAAGDIIEIDASGTYTGDTCAWSTDNLTVRGVNGRAKIDITGTTPAQQKGLFTISASNATIENLELSGAAISVAAGNNGAGIRHQGLNLTVRGCYFHDNQNGILGAPSTAGMGQVLIEYSEFAKNGAGDGYSHNMYIGNYAKFILQHSYSHRGNVGHLVKTRAYASHILYNRITDEPGGTASYEVDIPNAGTAYVIGNIIEQAATTQNPSLLAYGEEGVPAGYDNRLFVVNNTFINTKGSGTFVNNTTTMAGVLTNNIFYGGGTVSSQSSAVQATNFVAPSMGDPKFVNLGSFDVHLSTGSPCADKGSDPGQGSGMSLVPGFEYVHPVSRTVRTTAGSAIDIGAYELGNLGGVTKDGGISDTDGGTSDTDGGQTDTPQDGGTAEGCSCDLSSHKRSPGPLAWMTLIGALLVLSLRRRRA